MLGMNSFIELSLVKTLIDFVSQSKKRAFINSGMILVENNGWQVLIGRTVEF